MADACGIDDLLKVIQDLVGISELEAALVQRQHNCWVHKIEFACADAKVFSERLEKANDTVLRDARNFYVNCVKK